MSNAKFPYLSSADVANFPSIKHGYDPEKELSLRQQASAFIQEMGQRLQCTQCTMNTAIVYMHRFYYLNSFTKFHRNTMAPACLFLACKVEEQPRKVEHIIKVVYRILFREKQPPEPNTEEYLQKAEELVVNENILLQTLGFRIIVDHPHPHIVRYCDRDLANTGQGHHIAQLAWFLATNSLHLTTFCLQHPPTIIAALCIYLSCKYISCPLVSKSNQPWWFDLDRNTSEDLLTKLAYEFVSIMDKAPTKYKTIKGSKIVSESLLGQGPSQPLGHTFNGEDSSFATMGSSDAATADFSISHFKPHEPHDKSIKAESVEEKTKPDTEKSQRSAATTDDDELSSPPRKQSKMGTAISLKDYKARKLTMEQQVGLTLTTQAGESPNLEHRTPTVKGTESPTAGVSNIELIQSTQVQSANNKVPASLRDLPPLEPLTLSAAKERPPQSDLSSAKDPSKLSRHSLDPSKPSDRHNSSSHGDKPARPDADRHRLANHHHHHHHNKPPSAHGPAEEGAKVPSSLPTAPGSANSKHHRHHRPRHHHSRNESGEKVPERGDISHHQRHNSVRHSESEHAGNIANNGSSTKPLSVASTTVEMSSKVSIDGSLMDACQILLATPPSPSSMQHQDLMDVVKSEQSSDVNPSAASADLGQAVV